MLTLKVVLPLLSLYLHPHSHSQPLAQPPTHPSPPPHTHTLTFTSTFTLTHSPTHPKPHCHKPHPKAIAHSLLAGLLGLLLPPLLASLRPPKMGVETRLGEGECASSFASRANTTKIPMKGPSPKAGNRTAVCVCVCVCMCVHILCL